MKTQTCTPETEGNSKNPELTSTESRHSSLLRFITCGSVDDGKSTLIGRLLYETGHIHDDQIDALKKDCAKPGTTENDMDFSLLLDGLRAEREQGITIDVAYRFFSTDRRRYIVADTPGHEEYTRNMVTGASTADAAIILVDAGKGLLPQTKRHSFIASLLGIKHVILAVNKIDLVDYDEKIFRKIESDYLSLTEHLDFLSIISIPLSARYGDNISRISGNMPWFQGKHLLDALDCIPIESDLQTAPMRFPVQSVVRSEPDFRGYAGTIASGHLSTGQEILVTKSGVTSKIKRILGLQGDVGYAVSGQAITVCLDDDLDVSRGDILVNPSYPPYKTDRFTSHMIWLGGKPMAAGRSYILQTETDKTEAVITKLEYRINIDDFSHECATFLEANNIGFCSLSTQSPIAFDSYSLNRSTGSFILVDRLTNDTVGAGMIVSPLQKGGNIHWEQMAVTKEARSAQKYQKPFVLWFTGLSGAGKSTIANMLEQSLFAQGKHTYILDGDNIRHGLTRDLGFTETDRAENIRRVAETAKLMVDAGLIVLVSFISPYKADRNMARSLFEEDEFLEIFVDASFEVCAQRDPKGLYKKALRHEIKNFTGLDAPYEAPEHPDIHLKTEDAAPSALIEFVEKILRERNLL